MANLYEVEIFQAGSRPASNGVMTTISTADLQEVIDTYNPKRFRAPAIISHSIGEYSDRSVADSELSHGFPAKLRLVGDRLYAGFEKISSKLANWIREGALHSVSPSFYLPNSPNNPNPGKWSLRHIAFLGATPPACKGMEPPPDPPTDWEEWIEPYVFNFNDAEDGVINFDMGMVWTSPWAIAADLFQRYREFLIESEDLETADRVLPSDQIAALREMAAMDMDKSRRIADLEMQVSQMQQDEDMEDGDGDMPMMYEEMTDYKSKWKKSGMTPAEVASASGLSEEEVTDVCAKGKMPSPKQKKALDKVFNTSTTLGVNMSTDMSEELEQQKSDLLAREEAITKRELALERQEVTSFVEGLVTSGRLASGRKQDTITLLLSTPNTQEVEFSETIGKKTPRQALMADYASRHPWNYAEEIVRTEDAPKPVSFAAPKGYAVDEKSHRVYREAIAYCESRNLNPNDYADWTRAIDAVGEGNGHG